jgi:hypothetical protein
VCKCWLYRQVWGGSYQSTSVYAPIHRPSNVGHQMSLNPFRIRSALLLAAVVLAPTNFASATTFG